MGYLKGCVFAPVGRPTFALTFSHFVTSVTEQLISSNNCFSVQFESGILDICLKILDVNPKCLKFPGKDCSKRGIPTYVSRVLSAMVSHFCCLHLLQMGEMGIDGFNLGFFMSKKHSFPLPARWIVMMTKGCCWEDGQMTTAEVSALCSGGAVWRSCAAGTDKTACLFATGSAGCLLQWPVQVR